MAKKIRMALYDSDGYMISLVKYLCKRKQEIVETRLFTNPSMLQDYVKAGQADVLLAQEEEADWIGGLESFVPQIILLTEGNMIREQSKYIPVFRYQSAEEVVREMMEAVAEDERIAYTGVAAHRQGEIICGYSPFGGGGVSTFLFHMAGELAKNYRTLYVSLEEFCGMENTFSEGRRQQRETYRGMSEVIFYLQQRKERLALKLESLIYEWEQLDYLPPVENYRDLYQMSRGDMELFLKILFQETSYDKMVFDVGYLGEASEYLLEHSDKIYMPSPKTSVQERKQRACEQAWVKIGSTGILEKIHHITMGGADVGEEKWGESQ